ISLITATLIISACSAPSENQTSDKLLEIGDVTVSSEYFEEAYIQNLIRTGRNDSPRKRWQFLQVLTNDLLLAQQFDVLGIKDEQFQFYSEKYLRKAIVDYTYFEQFMDTLSPPTEAQVRTAFMNSNVKYFVSHIYFEHEKDAMQYHQR